METFEYVPPDTSVQAGCGVFGRRYKAFSTDVSAVSNICSLTLVGPGIPVGPVDADAPCFPVGPVTTEAAPIAPVLPVGPVTADAAPTAPVLPVGPVTMEAAPIAPVLPVGPVTVDAAPLGPVLPAAPLLPVGPAIAGRILPVTTRSPVTVSCGGPA